MHSRKKKNYRKKDIEDIEEEAEQVVVAKPIKRKKILTSIESDGPEIKYEKKMLNVITKAPTAQPAVSGAYSRASLEEMKAQMNATRPALFEVEEVGIDIYIPDKESINATKKIREEKRKQAETSTNVEYIPLDETTVAKLGKESRIEVDEENMDTEETFDDYKGKSIVFGANAVKEAKELAKKERIDLLRDKENESDDEQVREWEMQRIHFGKREKQEIILDVRGKQKPVSIPIPNIPESLHVDDTVKNLQFSVENLRGALAGYVQQIDILNRQINDSIDSVAKMKIETETQSNRHDYFQEFTGYIQDLAEFMDSKMPLLEQMEQDIIDLNVENMKQLYFERYRDLDMHGNLIFKGSVQTSLNEEMKVDIKPRILLLIVEEDIDDGIKLLFADASKYFRKISIVKEKLEGWKVHYPKEYEQAYGSLSLAGVFDIYVRHELLTWNPLKEFTKFEKMQWHSELTGFGITAEIHDPDDQLLSRIVEKTIIPKLQNIILSYYDVFSYTETDNLYQCLNIILDYVSKKSNAFQDLLDSLEDRIADVVKSLLDHVGTLEPYVASQLEILAKGRWLDSQFKLIKNIMVWRKYFPASVIKRWVYEKLIARSILVCLETCSNIDSDVEFYLKISDCVRDFIPTTNSTPSDLKFLETSFQKLYLEIERNPSKKLLQQSEQFYNSINNYYQSSLVNRKLKSI
ncbi:hypothetical protein HDV01_002023 [Terramyces sp. JEL0728]|nr:hypothetical protein HDV01_002023 [Terramyces sp. JEL0728]